MSDTSTHKCEVVPVTLMPHPNADSLSIVQVFGYQVCVKTETWQGITLGAYIVPDSLVDAKRPEFAFLEDGKGKPIRIKARRLRGVISYGLLIPAPDGSKEGDDVAEQLGIERYEATIHIDRTGYCTAKTEHEPGPDVPFRIPVYDVEAFQRYAKSVFQDGEQVYVSEKIDGANTRFMFDGNKMFIGTRKLWCKTEGNSLWHKALAKHPEIEEFCRKYPNTVVYGETFGWVQDLRYGMAQGLVDFIAFDILSDGKWMDAINFVQTCKTHGLPTAPSLGFQAYDFDALMKQAEGKSLYPSANHYREGIVIRPVIERWDHKCGRVQLKLVSAAYLENGGAEKPWSTK